MRSLGKKTSFRRAIPRALTGAILIIGGSAAFAGCGDDTTTSPTTSLSGVGAQGGAGGQGGVGGVGGVGGAGGVGGQGGSGGGGACVATAPGATRGSSIAISPDDTVIVAANRDAGTVSVITVEYAGPLPVLTKTAEIEVGAEPWQVAIDGCGEKAYVATRKDQTVVEIVDLKGVPTKGGTAIVGSEPTGLVITPNNGSLYVANWVDGTLSVISTATMTVEKTLDLNPVLAETGLLGPTVTGANSRPALAHPRSLAITNDLDADDTDERVYVTEYFAHRTMPEEITSPSVNNVDTNWKGLLYRVNVADDAIDTVNLPALTDTGFENHRGESTGCFANQVQSVTIDGGFAYITSICASPAGPTGAFTKGACTTNAQCMGANTCVGGSCTGSCLVDSDCGAGAQPGACNVAGGGSCAAIQTNIKTMTHPVVHVVDLATDLEVPTGTSNLNRRFEDLFVASAVPDDHTRRVPLVANDIGFVPGTGIAYVTANGADAVFRVTYDAATGVISEVGAPGAHYIDLAAATLTGEQKEQDPTGVAVAFSKPFAFVSNAATQNISAVDLDPAAQIVAGSDNNDARVIQSSDPPVDLVAQAKLRGRHFFNTGLGRWSLKGQAWSACQSCHQDGLSDNVTWYFARGPRQATSLEGSFHSANPTDQRVFNWNAVNDEMPDFEGIVRAVNGGVGAIVSVANEIPTNADRINTADVVLSPPAGAGGINGSSELLNDTLGVLEDWNDIKAFVQSIRSPRAPSNLDPVQVAAGATLFQDLAIGGKCQGCHGGAKWTISTRFYAPSGVLNEALLTTTYDGMVLIAAGFPAALIPGTPGNQFMRSPNPKSGAFDQMQCLMRPVGTFGVSPVEVNVIEKRSDMVTDGQGNEATVKGFNPPSLLGLSIGAPYFHAGNARTLEELLDVMFSGHHGALTQDPAFLNQADDVDALVAFLLSIDEDTTPIAIPAAAGADGGDFCAPPP